MVKKFKMDRPVVGFTSSRLVMLDLDNARDTDVVSVAQYALNRWKLGGYLILKSSVENPRHGLSNYHIIFDKYTTWAQVMHVIGCLLFKTRNETLQRWTLYQMVKKGCTLRISNKGEKPAPSVVARVGTQHQGIREYTEIRRTLGHPV